MLGFSLTSPDLVICAGSPDIPTRSYEESPEFLKGSPIDLSLENGINGPEFEDVHDAQEAAFHDASFDLFPRAMIEDEISKDPLRIISINSGSLSGNSTFDGIEFLEDDCFTGGDTIRTDTVIGNGKEYPLYQTARFGNFSYHFKTLKPGYYIVDLRLAEIVFTDGPAGMRVFDVFIQEHKVISHEILRPRLGKTSVIVVESQM